MVRFVCPQTDSEAEELSESSLAFCMVTGSEVVPTIFFFDFLAFFFLFCLLFKVVLLASFSFLAARSVFACNLVRALRVGFGLGFLLRIILLIMFNDVITGASGGLCGHGHCGIKWVIPQSLHIALGRCGLGIGVALVLDDLYGQSTTLWGSPQWKHCKGFL